MSRKTKARKCPSCEERREKSKERAARKSRSPQCYARIDWAMCCQEWYLEGTYDAKRRAVELRHMGFEVTAKSVGEVPLEDGTDEIKLVKITILTARYRENEKGELVIPPDPKEIAAGLVDGG